MARRFFSSLHIYLIVYSALERLKTQLHGSSDIGLKLEGLNHDTNRPCGAVGRCVQGKCTESCASCSKLEEERARTAPHPDSPHHSCTAEDFEQVVL